MIDHLIDINRHIFNSSPWKMFSPQQLFLFRSQSKNKKDLFRLSQKVLSDFLFEKNNELSADINKPIHGAQYIHMQVLLTHVYGMPLGHSGGALQIFFSKQILSSWVTLETHCTILMAGLTENLLIKQKSFTKFKCNHNNYISIQMF